MMSDSDSDDFQSADEGSDDATGDVSKNARLKCTPHDVVTKEITFVQVFVDSVEAVDQEISPLIDSTHQELVCGKNDFIEVVPCTEVVDDKIESEVFSQGLYTSKLEETAILQLEKMSSVNDGIVKCGSLDSVDHAASGNIGSVVCVTDSTKCNGDHSSMQENVTFVGNSREKAGINGSSSKDSLYVNGENDCASSTDQTQKELFECLAHDLEVADDQEHTLSPKHQTIKVDAPVLPSSNENIGTDLKLKEESFIFTAVPINIAEKAMIVLNCPDSVAERTCASVEDVSSEDNWNWEGWTDGLVQKATTQVSSLVEMVESHLGIPDPVKVARLVTSHIDNKTAPQEDKQGTPCLQKVPEKSSNSMDGNESVASKGAERSSWFSGFGAVSALTNLVHGSSQDVISGSIGALEFLGKKTVDLISSGDPGFRSHRAALSGKKLTLSSVLQEARTTNPDVSDARCVSGRVGDGQAERFNPLFDKFQGFAHLGALEMLSNDCESKLERILLLQSDKACEESRVILMQVRHELNFSESDLEDQRPDCDFKKEVFASTKSLELKVMSSKLLNTWVKLNEDLEKLTSTLGSDQVTAEDIYSKAISSVAEFSSRCIELYRKIADMLVLTDMTAKQRASQRANSIKNLSTMFLGEVSRISAAYADCLVALQRLPSNKDEISKLITEMYVEVSTGSSYIGDAHKLLLPILQCSVIK